MPAFKLIIFILFIIVVASFASKNMQGVEINYIDHQFETQSLKLPVMIVILAPFCMGFVLAWIISGFNQMKLKSALRKKKKIISQLTEDLDQIKAKLSPEEESPKIVSEK